MSENDISHLLHNATLMVRDNHDGIVAVCKRIAEPKAVVVPWDDLPPHLIAWAMDEDRHQYYYNRVPDLCLGVWKVAASKGEPYNLGTCFLPEDTQHVVKYDGDWEESLRVRP